MARTKQTARKSTGARAPRRQLATTATIRYGSGDDDGEQAVGRQVNIFNEQKTRTIVVEGTSVFDEMPNIIHLSFLIEKVSDTVEEGIHEVIQKISQVRSIATEIGVKNENISSDSIGSKMMSTEYGVRNEETGEFEVRETKNTYEVKSVVRIILEEEEEGAKKKEGQNVQSLFGKVCYDIMTKAGLRTHEAPRYDLSDLTALRNTARRSACENAKEKATAILDALDDTTVKLGRPIAITDLHCDIKDDAEDSFLGNIKHDSAWQIKREVIDKADAGKAPPRKKQKKTKGDSSFSLDEEAAQQIFVVPPTRVMARVKAIFEIEAE